MQLGIWNSIAIVLGFSFLVVGLDEYVAKPWRHRRLEARAKTGDKEAIALLHLARTAKVSEE